MTGGELKLLLNTDSPLVLEIGCHNGADSAVFLATFPRIEIHCFEPEPRAIAKSRARIDDPRCTLYECAIAAADGKAKFWQSDGLGKLAGWDLSGSIHEPTGHRSAWPAIEFPSCITVENEGRWIVGRTKLYPAGRSISFGPTCKARNMMSSPGAVKRWPERALFYSEFYQSPMYEGQRDLQGLLGLLGADWEFQWVHNDNFLARNRTIP